MYSSYSEALKGYIQFRRDPSLSKKSHVAWTRSVQAEGQERMWQEGDQTMRRIKAEGCSHGVLLEQPDRTASLRKTGCWRRRKWMENWCARQLTGFCMIVIGVDASLELRGEVKAEYIRTQYRKEIQALEISVVCLESTHRSTFLYGKWLSRQFSHILN